MTFLICSLVAEFMVRAADEAICKVCFRFSRKVVTLISFKTFVSGFKENLVLLRSCSLILYLQFLIVLVFRHCLISFCFCLIVSLNVELASCFILKACRNFILG